MRQSHFIYQDIVDPIVPLSIEVVTMDKWYKDHPRPVLRKSISTAILAGAFFFVNIEANRANDKVPDWHPQHNQPQRLVSKLLRQHTGEFRFEVPRTILLTDWFQEAKHPYFSKKRFYHTGESRFESPRIILLSDWSQPIQTLGKQKQRQLLGGEARTDVVVPAEEISVDKWGQPTQQPRIVKLRNSFFGEYRFEIPRLILLSDWWQRTSEPYFNKKRNYFTGEFKFEVPREVLLTDWFQSTQQPHATKIYRGIIGVGFRTDIVAPVEIVTMDKWYQALPEPIRRKIERLVGGEFRTELQAIPPEIVTIDKWYQITQQPQINKQGGNLGNFVLVELVTLIPPTPDAGVKVGDVDKFRKDAEEGRIRLIKKLLDDDEDLIIILSSWMVSKKDS